jgi:hypothetical protein
MQVGGRGGRRRCAVDAPMAPAPPQGPVCPEHMPGPCPPWLSPFHVEHGHGPCPPLVPPAPDVVGPSNWAGPTVMDVEPALPTPDLGWDREGRHLRMLYRRRRWSFLLRAAVLNASVWCQ